MYLQKCFIRTAPKELTEKLYRLGHRKGTMFWNATDNVLLVAEADSFRCYDNEWGNADNFIKKGYIDCGKSEELFLAIAALSDTTDNHQWFICDENIYLPTMGNKKLGIGDMFQLADDHFDNSILAHKASVEELVEHFKR